MEGGAERADIFGFALRRDGLGNNLLISLNTWCWELRRQSKTVFTPQAQWCPGTEQEAVGTGEIQDIPIQTFKRVIEHYKVAQRCHGPSIFGDAQNLAGHSSGQSAQAELL